jgi:hypothetical protein
MTPSRIANKLRGECSYHTPIRVVLSTKKLGIILVYSKDVASGVWTLAEVEYIVDSYYYCKAQTYKIYNSKKVKDILEYVCCKTGS